ncbi:MAG: C-GCAxxG-C-C family protein [Oscillospiraceae bacterium]|jgi:C_GCAxxG_C_C family probable redox protein|nr:C-GCAxxG-C-C family protein [Oscillospiraceae bacterium]
MNHEQRAVALFKQGYNCSQSVFAAFSEELGINQETALKISSSFGGGMGRLREVCGAVSGMFMVLGLKEGYTDPTDGSLKAQHYQKVQELAKKFEQKNGSIVCRELLGLNQKHDSPIPESRTKSYYKKRPCAELVGMAAKFLDEFFEEENQKGNSI